jgi:signal transduction histidine kinase
VGTWGGGLVARKGDRFESPGDLAKITDAVLSLYQGRKGELWVGTRSGLHRYEKGVETWYGGPDKLAQPDVRAIAESADGTIWFGMSGGGLGSLKNGKLRQIRKADGLGSDFIISLYADPDGTLWLGSSDNGLTRSKDGKFSVLTAAQGLPNRIISGIVDDGAENLWFGSQAGILRASKSDLYRCADGSVNKVQFLSYGKAEGLAVAVCTGGFQPGACRTSDGRLWFPTVKGLAIVDPVNVTTNTAPPPVVIEEFLTDGKPVDLQPLRVALSKGEPSPTFKIPKGIASFEIRYTALSYAAPDKVRFRSRLDELQPEWVGPETKRFEQFSFLRPGTYHFHVIACNNDEFWNNVGASLTFTVLPYFWQTWWFQTGSLVSGAGLVGVAVMGVTRRRVRQKLESLERQRALERERARIARDIHDDLGASLTRISMLSQTVRSEVEGQPQAAADIDQIYGTARELTRAMDEIVWAVNPKHDTFDSLVTYLGRFAQHFLSAAGIRCRLDVPDHLPPWTLTAEIRHNVFLALKEALNNIAKHANATEARISIELQPHGFALLIADNGRGFDLNAWKTRPAASADGIRLAGGNGLLNMKKRLEEIGGACEWTTAPGEGTRASLTVPIK